MTVHEQKLDFNSLDEECLYPSISYLANLNRTRTIVLQGTATQLVLAIVSTIVAGYFFVFGYNFEITPFQAVLLSVLLLICLSFALGLLAAHRNHAHGLLLFAKLLLIDLIALYLSLTFFLVIPAGKQKYLTDGIVSTAFFVMSYLTAFGMASVLPAFTVRYSYRLAKLLTDSEHVV